MTNIFGKFPTNDDCNVVFATYSTVQIAKPETSTCPPIRENVVYDCAEQPVRAKHECTALGVRVGPLKYEIVNNFVFLPPCLFLTLM